MMKAEEARHIQDLVGDHETACRDQVEPAFAVVKAQKELENAKERSSAT
jgi:hypothetical protein